MVTIAAKELQKALHSFGDLLNIHTQHFAPRTQLRQHTNPHPPFLTVAVLKAEYRVAVPAAQNLAAYFVYALYPWRGLRVLTEQNGVRVQSGLYHNLVQHLFLPLPPEVIVLVEAVRTVSWPRPLTARTPSIQHDALPGCVPR